MRLDSNVEFHGEISGKAYLLEQNARHDLANMVCRGSAKRR